MSGRDIFSAEKLWFKGNLHTHSTVSDGKLEPQEVVARYQSLGYDFLAFTDHEIFSWWQELSTPDLLILPGIETSGRAPGPYQCHHVVGVGASTVLQGHLERYDNREITGVIGAQTMIDTLNESGYFSIYCHPVWSRQTFDELKDLVRFHAIEVYNHGCHVENATGKAEYYWDAFLRQGKRIWGVATDDSHGPLGEYGGGWVMVSADSLDPDKILDSLRNGHFYSTSGPSIERFGLKNGEVYVECSRAQEIHFIAFEQRGASFIADKDEILTSAKHTLHGDELFVRVEIIDEWGKTAWSNPIFL